MKVLESAQVINSSRENVLGVGGGILSKIQRQTRKVLGMHEGQHRAEPTKIMLAQARESMSLPPYLDKFRDTEAENVLTSSDSKLLSHSYCRKSGDFWKK